MNVPATWNEFFVPAGQKKTPNQTKLNQNKKKINFCLIRGVSDIQRKKKHLNQKEKNSLL